MGIENVKLAYARWTHLADRSFRLLVFMATVSLDDDDPPRFWMGREAMAYGIGRMTPIEPAASDSSARADHFRKARTADFQAVKLALGILMRAGVVVLERRAAPGRNAVYALCMNAPTGYVWPTEQGTSGLPTGYVWPTEQGTSGLPAAGGKGGVTSGAKEEQLGAKSGSKSPQATTSPAPTANNGAERSQMTYSRAAEILQSMPDLGAEYLSRTPDGERLETRVVMAALIHLSERSTA